MSLYTDASLIMFPSGYKEDKIYSLKPTDGSGDLTFTRASTATRVNADGLIETSPVNLLTYSEQFDNADWLKLEVTISANTLDTIDPFGNNNADKIIDNAVNDGHFVYRSGWNTNEQTASFYAKSGTYSKICVVNASTGYGVFANLSTGTVFVSSGFTGTIESVSNGWYKITATHLAASAQTFAIGFFTGTNNISFSGTGSFAYIFGAQLNIGATAKPYFPTTDRLNVPRIDYTGGGCGKLLLEPQRTNLALYSEQIDNAAWTKLNLTVSANSVTSPDGTQNADTITSISASPSINSPIAVFTSTTNVSIFVKYVSQQWVMLMNGGAVNDYANFDIQNGVIGSVGSTSSNAQIQSFGNGWYRISVTFSGYAGNTNLYFGFIASGTSAWNTFDPNFNKSLYAWGCQIENSSYPTSYIPTTSSSATRVADACFKTGISSLIGQTEGTLFAELPLQYLNFDNYRGVISVSDGTFDNGAFVFVNNAGGSSTQFSSVYRASGSSVASFQATNLSNANIGSTYKIAIAYKANDFVFYINGVQIGSDNSGAIAGTLSRLDVGSIGYTGLSTIDRQSVNQAVVFPTRLTNAQLATLTTI